MRKEDVQSLAAEMRKLAENARDAARTLSHADTRRKNAALRAAADAVLRREREDLEAARAAGQNDAYLDRLALDPKRLGGIAAALLEIAALPDPVGEVTASWRRPNGLEVRKVRIPLGV